MYGSRNKAKKIIKKTPYKNIDKTSNGAILDTINHKGKKMKPQNVFLPFWKLFAAIFVWYLFLEGLKKLGLVKSK